MIIYIVYYIRTFVLDVIAKQDESYVDIGRYTSQYGKNNIMYHVPPILYLVIT